MFMNKHNAPSLPYRVIRTLIYVCLVYTRAIGGVFYRSMDNLVREVELDAEMKRRGSVLKQHKSKFNF